LPKKPDDKSDDESSDSGLDEWKAARDVFDKFDDRISDLRKFGFTFLSGLIAADALTKLFAAPDDRIRLGVVGITLLLTVALMVLDKNYQLFQIAAGIRAKILEVRLNLELTETIAFRSDMDKFRDYVLAVYLAFAGVAGLVGILLFYPKVTWLLATSGFTIIAAVSIYLINRHQPNLERQVDWSLDRTTCALGEKIRITVTNLCPKDSVSFPKGNIWVVRKEDGTKDVYSEPNPGIVISEGNNYSWELSTDKLKEPGIYRVFPAYVEKKEKEGLWSEIHRAFQRVFHSKVKEKIKEEEGLGLWSAPLKRAIIVKPKLPEKVSGRRAIKPKANVV
jgi:membrane protein implicated in regulation of membrane protease activity